MMSDVQPIPDPTVVRRYRACELVSVWIAGMALMVYFHSATGGPAGDRLGVPGNDSFYHIRMAALMPRVGLLQTFPWLRFAWFTADSDAFVSHHYGFHALLVPFLKLATLLGFDELAGGRWAIAFFFGLIFAMFDALLMAMRVRMRVVWLALFLLLPFQFFERLAYVRAIGPALVCMLLLVWLIIRRRPVLAGLLTIAFIQVYLGAVMYVPLIVGSFVLASLIGPVEGRRIPWMLLVCAGIGWAIGISIHPYSGGMFEFLRVQVLGTGLSPDISVGREWQPYNNVWWFAGQMAGVLLAVWMAALLWRLRAGPPVDVNTTAVTIISVAFLVLTLKARRFVEFWPVFMLLSAAYLSQPLSTALAERAADWRRRRYAGGLVVLAVAACLLVIGAVVALAVSRGVLAPLADGYVPLIVVAMLLVLVPLSGDSWIENRTGKYRRSAAVRVLGAMAMLAVVALAGGQRLQTVRATSRCRYDLKTISEMMDYLKANSPPGDTIFTDDWDVFPVYFYHNTHNRYVVGLDPKFTHEHRPDLWTRYVRITRGQVPAEVNFAQYDLTGTKTGGRARVELTDIQDHFDSRFIIVDRDHRPLRKLLDQAWDFAEPFWPADPQRFADALYRVYRVRDPYEVPPPRPAPPPGPPIVYLNAVSVQRVEPADTRWSVDMRTDKTPIEVSGRVHLHGLSTRVPVRMLLNVPSDVDRFEATLAPAAGVRVRGEQSGEVLFRADSGHDPQQVSVRVRPGVTLALIAEPVDEAAADDVAEISWASARWSGSRISPPRPLRAVFAATGGRETRLSPGGGEYAPAVGGLHCEGSTSAADRLGRRW